MFILEYFYLKNMNIVLCTFLIPLCIHAYFSNSHVLSFCSVSQMKESNSQDDFKIKVQLICVVEVHIVVVIWLLEIEIHILLLNTTKASSF